MPFAFSTAAAARREDSNVCEVNSEKMFSCWDELNCTTAHFVFRMKFTFFFCGILETLRRVLERSSPLASLFHTRLGEKRERENFAQLLFFTSILTLFWFLCCCCCCVVTSTAFLRVEPSSSMSSNSSSSQNYRTKWIRQSQTRNREKNGEKEFQSRAERRGEGEKKLNPQLLLGLNGMKDMSRNNIENKNRRDRIRDRSTSRKIYLRAIHCS